MTVRGKTTPASTPGSFTASSGRRSRSTPWQRTQPPLAEIPLSVSNVMIDALTHIPTRGDFDVNAPYQRGSVWTVEQRQDFIRSMLLRVPVGAIIRAHTGNHEPGQPLYRIVDGRQRLEALWAFTDGKVAVPAEWFPDRHFESDQVDGDGNITWDALTIIGRRKFESRAIAIIELDSTSYVVEGEPGTGDTGSNRQYAHHTRSEPEAVAYEAEVYRLINSAGTDHTDTDLARAARSEHPPPGRRSDTGSFAWNNAIQSLYSGNDSTLDH